MTYKKNLKWCIIYWTEPKKSNKGNERISCKIKAYASKQTKTQNNFSWWTILIVIYTWHWYKWIENRFLDYIMVKLYFCVLHYHHYISKIVQILTKLRWVSYSEFITGEDKHFQTDFKTLSNARIKKSVKCNRSIIDSSLILYNRESRPCNFHHCN